MKAKTESEKLKDKKDAFKVACYLDEKRRQSYYHDLITNKILGVQEFRVRHEKSCQTDRLSKLLCKNCAYSLDWIITNPSDKCRYCHLYVDLEQFKMTYSYWNAYWCVCHVDCYEDGKKQEAIDCQIIDADCNDCKFFGRGLTGKDVSYGLCKKYDIMTCASSNFCSLLACFEHRKSND